MNRRTLLAMLFVMLLAVVGAAALESVRLVGSNFPGFFVWDNGSLVILSRDNWTGVQSGLPLDGGRILSFDGSPFRSGADLLRRAAEFEPGHEIHYEIVADGLRSTHRVATMRFGVVDWLVTIGSYLGNALCLLLIALVAIYARADALESRSLALASGHIGLLLAGSVDFFTGYHALAVLPFLEALLPVSIFFFVLVFPSQQLTPVVRRVAIAGIALACFALGAARWSTFYTDPEQSRSFLALSYTLISVAGLTMIARLLVSMLRADNTRDRMRSAVVFSGAIAGFLLPALGLLAFAITGVSLSFGWIVAPIFVFALAILVAVVRFELFDAERVLRLTVGYAAASSGVFLAYTTALLALQALIAPAVIPGLAASVLLILLAATLFDPIRRRAQIAVDRIFFRSTIDAGRILEEAAADLAELVDERAIFRFVGDRLASALSLEWARLVGPEDADDADAVERESVTFRGERMGTLLAGAKRSGAPFSAAEREVVRGMAVQGALALRNARSVGELERAQAEMLRSKQLAEIGELTNAVAHGIRNPLAGIRASAQVGREEPLLEDAREALSTVLSEADRLEHRIRNLLDFSKPFQPDLQAVNLADVLRETASTIELRGRAEGIEVELAAPDSNVSVIADRHYLAELMLELCSNALNAMAAGGRLTIGASVENGHAAIDVIDTGRGIPAAVQERVFELFFTTRAEGTGVGLATVAKILERMQGSIDLTSSGPDGTRFRVELPIARSTTEPTERSPGAD